MTADLRVYWSKREKDLVFVDNGPTAQRCDARLLYNRLEIVPRYMPNVERGLLDELEARGYDLSTLRISISKKRTERKP